MRDRDTETQRMPNTGFADLCVSVSLRLYVPGLLCVLHVLSLL
jgi:hypothetical protein